jgi:intein/homing endonuclease
MKARNIWDKILSNMVISAEPGLLNTSNLYKNNSYYFAMPTCFSGDTLISTVDGLIPIKELVDQSIKVVTDLRCIHSSGTFIENGYGSFSGQKELFEILLQNKQKIKLTAEHLVWTQKGWKQVKELIPNKDKMYVQTSVSQHVLKEYNKTAFDNGFLVGYLVGDGWICYHHNNGAVQYGFVAHEDEIEIMKFISDAINLIIGSTGSNREPHWRRSSNGGKSFELVTTAKGVCDFFSTWDYTYKIGQHGYISCDKKSSKFVSDKVLKESTEFKKGFLAGLFAADGHMGTYHNSSSFRISLTSAKKHIIERVQILLNEFGVASSRGSHITSLNGKLFTSYTLNISRLLGNKAFQSFIGFGYSLKQKKLVEYKFQEKWQTSDYGGYLVKSITSIGIQDVYDISTEITHALVANGIVVHNSTNPCFNKGTLIQTKLGPRKIETLIGQNVEIWDGEQ